MTRPDRPRLFLDALSGLDGTQALRTPYKAPPVYPDASLGVPSRASGSSTPVRVRVVVPTVPVVDPQLLAELAEPLRPLAGPPRPTAARPPGAPGPRQPARPPAVRPGQPPAARRTTALAPGGVPAVQYNQQVLPTRQQAASAGHYQGPVPLAVAPAAASSYNAPMTYSGQQWSAFPPGTPGQSGTDLRRPATPPNATGSPALNRFTNSPPRKKTGWVQATLFLIIFVLIFSGLGSRLLDLLRQLLDR